MSVQPQNIFLRFLGYLLSVLRWLIMVFVFGLLCYAIFACVSAVIPVSAEVVSADSQPTYEVYLLKSGPHTDFLVKAKTTGVLIFRMPTMPTRIRRCLGLPLVGAIRIFT
jgi:hypothetical protein